MQLWVWTYQYFSVLWRLFAAANLYLSVLLQNIHGVSLYHSALLQKFEFVPLCTSYFCRLLYLSVLLTSADFLYLSVLLQTITAMSLHFMPRDLFVGKYSLGSLCIFHKLITQVWCQTAAFANNGCSQSVFLHFWTIFLPDWSVFKNKKWRESAQAAILHICAFCPLAIWVSKTFLSSPSQIRHEPKGAKKLAMTMMMTITCDISPLLWHGRWERCAWRHHQPHSFAALGLQNNICLHILTLKVFLGLKNIKIVIQE